MDPMQQSDPRVMTVMQQTGLPYAAAAQIVAQMGQAPASPGIMGSLGQAVGGLGEGLGQFGQKVMSMQQGAPQAADPLGLRTGAFNALKGGMDPMGLRTAAGNAISGAPQASAEPPPSPTPPSPPPANGPSSAQSESPAASGSPATVQGVRDSNSGGYPGRAPAAPSPDTKDAAKGPEQSAASATSGGTAPAQATSPAGGPYGAVSPQARDEQRFGYDPANDSPGSWASRVFMEGNKDAGLNLYDPTTGGSPWGRFLQSRYIPDLESRLILGEMNGGVGAGNEAGFAHSTLGSMSSGGGAPAGGNPFEALASAAKNLSSFANGGSFSDPSQTTALGRMANDPIAQSNAILGATRGITGGFGAQYSQSLLNDMQRQYANDPSQYQPGNFMQAALAKMGVR